MESAHKLCSVQPYARTIANICYEGCVEMEMGEAPRILRGGAFVVPAPGYHPGIERRNTVLTREGGNVSH